MRNGDDPIPEKEVEGLGVLRPVRPGGRVTDMPYSYVPFKPGKNFRVKNLGNKSLSLMLVQLGAVKSCDPCALLPPVLERVQGVVYGE